MIRSRCDSVPESQIDQRNSSVKEWRSWKEGIKNVLGREERIGTDAKKYAMISLTDSAAS